MRNPWTPGGLQKEVIVMRSTGRRATATAAMERSIRWSSLARGRSVRGVQTGEDGLRGGAIDRSMTERGLHPGVEAEIEAGRDTATEKVGDPSHLTGTGRGLEVARRAETGNAAAGRRRGGTGGRRAHPA